MRLLWAVVLCVSVLIGDEDFITKKEYASMLYQNPRGIGCHKCHGLKGEGKVLARYVTNKGPQTLVAPSIVDLSFEEFQKALNSKQYVMPRYYLTDKEVESLYYYVKMENQKKEK